MKDKQPIDPRVHRRVLRLLNTARTPEDLAFAPDNEIKGKPQETLKRPDVDEPGFERPRKKLVDLAQARELLQARDKASPLYGFLHFDHLREVFRRDWLAQYLDVLSMHLSAATFGEWSDAEQIQTAAGAVVNVVHAALVRTGRVLFIEAACNIPVSRTPLWERPN